MIDLGLLVSVMIAMSVPSAFQRRLGVRAPDSLFDLMVGPGIAGVLGGRAVAAALDDPNSLTNLKDFLVVRAGVEFWPGVVAAALWLALRAHRDCDALPYRLAQISGPAVIAYGFYELACVVRDDCFGPPSVVGLRPSGLGTVMFPVGLAMGLVLVVGGAAVARLWTGGWSALRVVMVSVGMVAVVRSVGSFWLPDLAPGLTRQHQQSIVMAVVALALLAAFSLRSSSRSQEPAGL